MAKEMVGRTTQDIEVTGGSQCVHAVIVAYGPDIDALDTLVACLMRQVDVVWLIDNGGPGSDALHGRWLHQVRRVDSGGNLGLASGYNRALSQARDAGAKYLLLLDQDSLPAEDMVAELLAGMRRLVGQGRKVAVVGPCYTDTKWATPVGFVQRCGLALKSVDTRGHSEVVVNHLVSSGSLFAIDVFEQVGEFSEQLFIDYVDIEWCLRAAGMGFESFGIPSARMTHDLGSRLVDGGKPALTLHEPVRQYYQYRNALWLMARPWAGWHWRAIDARRLLAKLVLLMLHAPDKGRHLGMILRGIGDALRGRMGRFSP